METFKPKDIYLPLGVNPDRFRFLVKRGNIVPETPTSGQGKANTFSPETAMKAGVFFFFEDEGFTLEQSEDIVKGIFIDDFRLNDALGVYDKNQSYWLIFSSGKEKVFCISCAGYHHPHFGPYTRHILEDGKIDLYVPKKYFPNSKGMSFFNISEILKDIAHKLNIMTVKEPSEA